MKEKEKMRSKAREYEQGNKAMQYEESMKRHYEQGNKIICAKQGSMKQGRAV